MKPPAFSYVAPTTVDECVELLSHYSDDAKILAGGQSLMPLLNLRMVRPLVIVDIAHVDGLDRWERQGDTVRIGALVRQRVIETDKALTEAVPLLAHAIVLIGHPATRSRGTIVGSMCHADPAAELPVCAVLLDAEFVVQSNEGSRTVAAVDFFEDALTTTIRSDEMVTEVRLPVAPIGAGFAFDEVARRHGDFALVSVAAMIAGSSARVAIGGATTRPTVFDFADVMAAQPFTETLIAPFAQQVAAQIEPNSDLHASADYRRSLAETLIERTLRAAFDRAARG